MIISVDPSSLGVLDDADDGSVSSIQRRGAGSVGEKHVGGLAPAIPLGAQPDLPASYDPRR
jgi:hypothetical protein